MFYFFIFLIKGLHTFFHVHSTEMEDMSEVVEHRQLLRRIQKAFPECNETKCYSIYHDVLKCVGNKRYVSRQGDSVIDVIINYCSWLKYT